MFDCVATGSVPLVVHCAAGKDRTGVAIAVLLRALDVSQQTAIEDYLLTNDAGDFEQFLRTRHDTQLGLTDIHHPLLSMPDDIRRVLFMRARRLSASRVREHRCARRTRPLPGENGRRHADQRAA